MLLKVSSLNICKKGVFLIIILVGIQTIKAQKLIDYLDVAVKNFTPQLNAFPSVTNRNTTQLEFGYFSEPQYTISGAQKAYVGFLQEVPWIGKSAAHLKMQKHLHLQQIASVEYQKEVLKFKVKELYYQLYQLQYEKDVYLILADKYRKHISAIEKDTINNDQIDLLKLFEQKRLLVDYTEKAQIIDGEYQNSVTKFNTLLKRDSFQEVELPIELAMPTEDQTMSFSDSYENPKFKAYEENLLALQQAQKYNNKWRPALNLGLRYTQVENDNVGVQLPTKDIVEPRLQLTWDLFSKNKKIISKEEIELMSDQKIIDLNSQLQIELNNQISAKISYFSVVEKLEELIKLKESLIQKNVSLGSNEAIQFELLKSTHEIDKVKAVISYYISSSKMLLYQ